jgi:hypothetical protein
LHLRHVKQTQCFMVLVKSAIDGPSSAFGRNEKWLINRRCNTSRWNRARKVCSKGAISLPDYRHLRAMVLALRTQSAGCPRAYGGAWLIRRPYDDLALDPSLCPGSAAPVARASVTQRIHLAHRSDIREDCRSMVVSVPCGGQRRSDGRLLSLGNARSRSGQMLPQRPPHVFARDGLRSYPAAIRCRMKGSYVARAAIEPAVTRTTASSPTTATSNGGCGLCRAREQ